MALREVILEDKAIYLVFEYAEHDFLVSISFSISVVGRRSLRRAGKAEADPSQQIIHHHSQTARTPIPPQTLRRLLYQLLCGVHFLHSNFVLHRDLKPANILVTSEGVVKIGDLGLARLWHKPLAQGGLYGGDKVVVTIWYRAPELIMGAKHYTAAIGGCSRTDSLLSGIRSVKGADMIYPRYMGDRMHLCGASFPQTHIQGRRGEA